MTESMPEQTAPEDDIFADLLESGTARRKTVDIYFNQAVIEEMEAIAAEVDGLSDGPETINQQSRAREIEARWNDAQERYEASKVTFTLTPIEPDVSGEIWDKFPNPPAPENPLKARWPTGQNGPDRERILKQREAAEARWQERMTEYRREVNAQETKRMEHMLAAAIVKVESAKGERPGMAVEQIEAIRSAPHGTQRINKLWEAFQEASTVAGEIPRPFSLGNFGSDPA